MTIPFNPRENNILVSVSFHNHVTLVARFTFDTGASFTTISQKMARSLRLSTVGTIEATTVSRVEKAPIAIVPRVSIGNDEVRSLEVIVKDLPPQSHVDGLLGLNFIKHFNVNIDFKHGKLTLQKHS